MSLEIPNLFELRGRGVRITFTAAGFAGQPELTLDRRRAIRTFRGDDVRLTESPAGLGTVVTATLSAIPDLQTESLALIIPTVQLPRGTTETDVDSLVVFITSASSIGGPQLVEGQVQRYATIKLSGTARLVDF